MKKEMKNTRIMIKCKKSVSLMLAMLMLLSCWVFTPMEVGAATTYSDGYTVVVNISAQKDQDNDFKNLKLVAGYADSTSETIYASATKSDYTDYRHYTEGYTLTVSNVKTAYLGNMYPFVSSTAYPTSMTYKFKHFPKTLTFGFEKTSTKNDGNYTISSVTVNGITVTNGGVSVSGQGIGANTFYGKTFDFSSKLPTIKTITPLGNKNVTANKSSSVTATFDEFTVTDNYGVRVPEASVNVSFDSDNAANSFITSNVTHSSDKTKVECNIPSSAQTDGDDSVRTIKVTATVALKAIDGGATGTTTGTINLTDATYRYTYDANTPEGTSFSYSPTEDALNYGSLNHAADLTGKLTGYKFDGWYEIKDEDFISDNTSSLGLALEATDTIKSDKRYYAAWTAQEVTVTVETGSETIKQGLKAGQNLTAADFALDKEPTKESTLTDHYKLSGWLNSATNTVVSTTDMVATPIVADTTFTAKFTPVSHNFEEVTVPAGEGVNGYTCQKCECGYEKDKTEIKGYYTVSATGADGQTYKEFTVTMGEAIGETLANGVVDPTKAPDEVATYLFESWKVAGKADVITDLATYTPTDTTILIPKFTSTYQIYDIIITDANNGSVRTTTANFGNNVLAVIESSDIEFKKDSGYDSYTWEFDGFTLDGAPVTAATTVTGDMELVATWKKVDVMYDVTIKDFDGTYINEQSVQHGSLIAAIAAPTRAYDDDNHYTFAGWVVYDEATYNNGVVNSASDFTDAATQAIKSDCEIRPVYTAQAHEWTAVAEEEQADGSYRTYEKCIVAGEDHIRNERIYYKVTFHMADGTTSEQEVTKGAVYAAANMPKADKASTAEFDYKFLGWSMTENGTVVDQIAGSANYDLYPIFDDITREYTITWLNNDGSVNTSTTQDFGTTISAPETPEYKKQSGDLDSNIYSFLGWKDSATGLMLTSATVSGDCTYIAAFAVDTTTHEVKILDKDDSVITTINVVNGRTLNELVNVDSFAAKCYTENGLHYDLTGWAFANDSSITDVKIYNDVTVKPVYTEGTHNYIKTETVAASCTHGTITKQTCECGYVHETEADDQGAHNFQWVVDKDATTTAQGHEVEICTICNEKRDGRDLNLITFYDEDSSTVLSQFTIVDGEKIATADIPLATKLTSDDYMVYTFDAWTIGSDEFDAAEVAAKDITNSTSFTASFTGVQHSKVTYMVRGIEYKSALYANGATLVLITDDMTAYNYDDSYNFYEFSHWSLTPDGEAVAEDTAITANTTVYAVFKATNKVVEVTYNANGGTINSNETLAQNQVVGSTIDASILPQKATDSTYAYDFAYWSTDIDGNDKFDGTFNEATTLYAQYTPVAIYNVTFLNHDGSVYKTLTVRADQTLDETLVNSVGTPTKAGDPTYSYYFKHWVYNETQEQIVLPMSLAQDITFAPVFEKSSAQTYTVKFVDEYGKTIKEINGFRIGDVLYDHLIPKMETKKDEQNTYFFKGWSPELKKIVDGNQTYKAEYITEKITYKVTFAINKSEILQEHLYVVPGTDEYYTLAEPTRDPIFGAHYIFNGWTTNYGEIDSCDANGNAIEGMKYLADVQQDTILYAMFRQENHHFEMTCQEANCTQDGGELYTCKDCGYSYMNVDVHAFGHDEYLLKSENDGTNYIDTYVCRVCGNVRYARYTNKDAISFDLSVVEKGAHKNVVGAKVELFDGTGENRILYTWTDLNGSAYFTVKDAGDYTVVVSGNAFESIKTKITLNEDGSVTTADGSNGTFEVEFDDCDCRCHKDGFLSTLFRFFHKLFGNLLGTGINCCRCPDPIKYEMNEKDLEKYYPSGK